MKVVCINNIYKDNLLKITIGKIYDLIEHNYYFIIINDENRTAYYTTEQLIPLYKYRKERISKLLEIL